MEKHNRIGLRGFLTLGTRRIKDRGRGGRFGFKKLSKIEENRFSRKVL